VVIVVVVMAVLVVVVVVVIRCVTSINGCWGPFPEGKVASIPSLSTQNAEVRHAWSFAFSPDTFS
jgi:hypothetical protein